MKLETKLGQVSEPGPHFVERAVPVVVWADGHIGEARSMLAQLDQVTRGYSVILVREDSNGNEQPTEADLSYLVESNVESVEAGSVGQYMALLDSPYLAVLPSDTFIYEWDWLRHIIDFMRKRPDVGLVGLSGWHSITESGVPCLDTSVSRRRGLPASQRPTWRFTEVAALDNSGLVMRNAGIGLRDNGASNAVDAMDLSLRYIRAGYRLYVAGVEFSRASKSHGPAPGLRDAGLAGGEGHCRETDGAKALFMLNWKDILPITRGFRDESYVHGRIDELLRHADEVAAYVKRVEEDWTVKARDLDNCFAYARKLEGDVRAMDDELANVRAHEAQLEKALAETMVARIKNLIARRRRGTTGN